MLPLSTHSAAEMPRDSAAYKSIIDTDNDTNNSPLNHYINSDVIVM